MAITTPNANSFAATEAQLEVWLSSQQSVEANCSYNELCSLLIEGELDTAALKNALDQIVQRHHSLRTTFSEDGSEAIIHDNLDYQYEYLDLSGLSSDDQEIELLKVIQKQACVPFDLVKGPLLRVVLQKSAADRHKLTFTAHHIIMDGWSLSVFCRDLGKLYDANRLGVTAELPVANQYRDYAAAMTEYFASEQGQLDEQFWVDQYTDSMPVLDLPIEKPRPRLRTYFGRRYDHVLPESLVTQVRKAGAKSGCSLFNSLLAAFSAYLSRLTGNEEIAVAIPTAGQAAMDQPELIGHCVNAMPYRTGINPDRSLLEQFTITRGEMLDAFEHQRYSFGSLLRKLAPPRDPSRPPLLAITFNVDPILDTSDIGFDGLAVHPQIEPRMFENFEWFVNGVIQKDQSIEMQVQYNSDLFTQEALAFYFEGFEAFLRAFVEAPETPINQLPLMSRDQRQRVIVDWNDTELAFPRDATLHSEFSRQAQQTPDAIAVEYQDQQLSYSDVDKRSNQIARYLQSQGIGSGDLVGICVHRSHDMLVYLYGILKSGAGYVPLDPAYPTDRLQYMCDHSRLKLIVTQQELSDRVIEFNKPHLALDQIDLSSIASTAIELNHDPQQTCYVIYTSGSTGKPKGVQVPHGPVANFLYSMRETPGLSDRDRVLAVTTLSFDIAVLELYLPTLFGGTVVVADQAITSDGNQLVETLQSERINFLQATPATWRLLINSGWEGHNELKVLCGGEPMPSDLVSPLLARCGELWNMYGPTETTVWSSAFRITNGSDPILIGQPIGNTQIYILDSNLQEVPVGGEGEVYIGGDGVTHGYLHQPKMTDERFIENPYYNPFVTPANHRLYRTGDLARHRFNGNLEFLRRNDKQVKVRGFRIELGEIEKNLESHPAIQQVVVIVREDNPGDARLVAYWLGDSDKSEAPDFRSHLRESVPYYMVPQHFIHLSQMPQTNNGKIDYKALPAPEPEESRENSEVVAPKSAAEKLLVSIWQDVLELDEVCIHDNFFDIGGHSLLVMQVIASVEKETGIRLSPQQFLMGTLEQLASKVTTDPTCEPSVTRDQPIETVKVTKQDKPGLMKKLKGFWD